MIVDEPKSATLAMPSGVNNDRTPKGFGPIAWILLLLFALALGVVICIGIASRAKAGATLKRDTGKTAVATVSVTYPKADSPLDEIVLPGNTQAYTDTPIYARTSGYLKHWYFDIGAHVKAGALLADIETPEVDQQLAQAKAQLATAQANFELAKSTAARWQDLLKTDSVSKQETDQKLGDLNAQKATVDSAESNVRRLREMLGFQKVYAPFSGVITARNVDTGSLIDAGANSPGRELFHLAALNVLRVYVSVPEVYSRAARTGATATLTLDEFPGRVFHGKLVRNANSIDMTARTLLVEVDVANPRGELLPGSYVQVHLKLPSQVRSVTIPSNTLLFRQEGMRVAVVRDGHVQLVPIKIGRDYGKAVEVVSGLEANDPLILNPADSILSGTPVHIRDDQSAGKSGGAAQ